MLGSVTNPAEVSSWKLTLKMGGKPLDCSGKRSNDPNLKMQRRGLEINGATIEGWPTTTRHL
jgi:hypothetical protein